MYIYIFYRSKKETLLARIYIHCFVVYKVYIANKRKLLFFFYSSTISILPQTTGMIITYVCI